MKKSALLFFLFCVVCTASLVRLDRHFFKSNASFSLNFIHSRLPNSPNWEICCKRRDLVDQILSQKFTYLTKGKQSFVFASEDGAYVLKFYRFPSALRPFSWLMRPFRKLSSHTREKLNESFLSFKLAYEELREETGLVLVHMNKTNGIYRKVIVTDKMGVDHTVDLNNVSFLLQKRGEIFFSQFNSQAASSDLTGAKATIEKTLALFTSCWQKGAIDLDPILDKNFGLIDGNPFIIDVGQWKTPPSLPTLKEYLLQMTASLEGKLSRESPELYLFYQETIEKLLTKDF
ncbi:MAG: hypothetical protein K940chlam2_00124 [Chlamydiae bacterium]|nr:hypothetical protein [Chlamydiota bacterium]